MTEKDRHIGSVDPAQIVRASSALEEALSAAGFCVAHEMTAVHITSGPTDHH